MYEGDAQEKPFLSILKINDFGEVAPGAVIPESSLYNSELQDKEYEGTEQKS
ncbi:MAG: hypothetical protein ACRYFS_21870 [Janthinobacterium lividum]